MENYDTGKSLSIIWLRRCGKWNIAFNIFNMPYNTSGMPYYTKKGFFDTFYALIYTFLIIDYGQLVIVRWIKFIIFIVIFIKNIYPSLE